MQISKRPEERGAIFVSSVLMLAGLLILSAFAIDIGTGRIARRDLQKMADIAALDVGRVLDGKTNANGLASAATTALNASLARNRSGIIKTSSITPAYTFGTVNANGQWLGTCTGSCVPTAVRVSVGGRVGIRFWPGSDIAPTQKAMAAQQPKVACLTVGSFLAGLDTNNGGLLVSVLNKIVGVNATVFSSQGLLAIKNVGVPLVDLQTALGIGGASDLLKSEVSLAQLASAAANVLSKQSDSASSSAALALNNIASAAIQNNFTAKIKLDKILQLGAGTPESVLSGHVNVFDLISAQMFAINGTNLLSIPTAGLSLPAGLGELTASATVINPPTIICGQAGTVSPTNSQIELTINGKIGRFKCTALLGCAVSNLLDALLGGLLGNLLGGWKEDTSLFSFELKLNAVNATTKINSIPSCEPTPRVDVTVSTSATSGSLKIMLANAIEANISIPGALGDPGQTHTFTSAPSTWVSAGGVGTNGSLIGPITIGSGSSASMPGGSVGWGVIIPGFNIGTTLSTVVNDLLRRLGVTLNGANVTLGKMGECRDLALRE